MPEDRKPQLPVARVTADLRARIEAGEWEPEQRLPPVKELALQLHTSRATLSKAIHALEEEGLLTVVPSWGVFRSS